MNHTKVNSSSIESIAHDGSILEIKFLHGGVYRYDDVPKHIYEALMASDSHGSFFHRHIKENYKILN